MNLSKKFEELILKQLESFGCSMGVTNLVMYLASAKQGTKASFELIGQWPQIDRILTSIEDDPSLKVVVEGIGEEKIFEGLELTADDWEEIEEYEYAFV